ncbi:MAG: MBL fold metallo-hydrolase [Planctomycetes bacterium]|nr:MBL fold metallo-hydrolase [Planctomycetota bacterium]
MEIFIKTKTRSINLPTNHLQQLPNAKLTTLKRYLLTILATSVTFTAIIFSVSCRCKGIEDMQVKTLILGLYENNSYIVRQNETSKDCIIVDTALDVAEMIDYLKDNNLNPVAIVLTHGHMDHIFGVKPLRKTYPEIKVYIHKLDAHMLNDGNANLSMLSGVSFNTDAAEHLFDEPDILKLAGIELQVLHTPGHTPGGVCFYNKQANVLFSGDTLFAESIGRTDFPNGSMEQLIENIKTKLMPLPDETIVLPGHGPETTIGQEKKFNQYLQ